MLKTLSPRQWCNQTIPFSNRARSAVSMSHHTMWVWGSARCDFSVRPTRSEKNQATVSLQKIRDDLQRSITARQSNKNILELRCIMWLQVSSTSYDREQQFQRTLTVSNCTYSIFEIRSTQYIDIAVCASGIHY